jgi:hypothetical protein
MMIVNNIRDLSVPELRPQSGGFAKNLALGCEGSTGGVGKSVRCREASAMPR